MKDFDEELQEICDAINKLLKEYPDTYMLFGVFTPEDDPEGIFLSPHTISYNFAEKESLIGMLDYMETYIAGDSCVDVPDSHMEEIYDLIKKGASPN